MKAIFFDAIISKYIRTIILGQINERLFYSSLSCISYLDIAEPRLPSENWVKVKTIYGGICGSDINLILLKDSPSSSPYVSFPFILGHENVGIVVEKGKLVTNINIGDRVTVDPFLSCEARQTEEKCVQCQKGDNSLCENVTKPPLAPGISIGFCKDTGGSWGEYFVAHKNSVFKVPEGVTNLETALVEPICSALHPVLKSFPNDNEKVLVIGAGIIGLLVVACLRALGSQCDITLLARHQFQGALGLELGANRVVYDKDETLDSTIQKITHGQLNKPILGKPFMI